MQVPDFQSGAYLLSRAALEMDTDVLFNNLLDDSLTTSYLQLTE